ncbi:MAG: UV DNA damage repair endonuclease UvsE [Desulfobacteraceae bacterium]|jgi:UV DNA damage endonuclease
MIRWGLCCIFKEEPITFRRTTATFLSKKEREEQLRYLNELIVHNAESLLRALYFCKDNGIGDFRINSQIFPLKTHPDQGYDLNELPNVELVYEKFRICKEFGIINNIRMGLHPDQFTLLSSPNPSVNERSIDELTYQAEMASMVNADVINIHGGGAYGDKPAALKRLRVNIEGLDDTIRERLTLENDDRVYTPEDLLPVCRDMGIPLVYDVHHHRCLPDGEGIEKTTELALSTWHREPLFHISSPVGSWKTKNPRNHSDYIEIKDFPVCWKNLNITIEVEAKAKELAVIQLIRLLQAFWI